MAHAGHNRRDRQEPAGAMIVIPPARRIAGSAAAVQQHPEMGEWNSLPPEMHEHILSFLGRPEGRPEGYPQDYPVGGTLELVRLTDWDTISFLPNFGVREKFQSSKYFEYSCG